MIARDLLQTYTPTSHHWAMPIRYIFNYAINHSMKVSLAVKTVHDVNRAFRDKRRVWGDHLDGLDINKQFTHRLIYFPARFWEELPWIVMQELKKREFVQA
jgi:hypothetical protein